MKRILLLLLTVITVFSLAACGGEKSTNNSAPSGFTDNKQSTSDTEPSNNTGNAKPADRA